MIDLRQTWLCALTLIALTACGNPQPPTAENPSNSTATTTNTETSGTDAKATLNQMQSYLAESTEAVKANDFAKAKAEFEEFDESWENIEDSVREKSKASYQEIEQAMDQVENTVVRPATPEPEQAIAALESLSSKVDNYMKNL